MSQPFIFDVAPTVAEVLGPAFHELPRRAKSTSNCWCAPRKSLSG